METKLLDIKTALQIARIIATAPEDRMAMIWDVFNKAGIDIEGLDEMAELRALSRQAYLIDAVPFLKELTEGREVKNGEYRIRNNEFNAFCAGKKLSSRVTKKFLAELGVIRISFTPTTGKVEYTAMAYDAASGSRGRYVCVYEDWENRIGSREK